MKKDKNDTITLLEDPDSGVHLNTLARRFSEACNVRTQTTTEENIEVIENSKDRFSEQKRTGVFVFTDKKDLQKRTSSIAEATFDSGDAILTENIFNNWTDEKAEKIYRDYASSRVNLPADFKTFKEIRTRILYKDKLEPLLKLGLNIHEFLKTFSKY